MYLKGILKKYTNNENYDMSTCWNKLKHHNSHCVMWVAEMLRTSAWFKPLHWVKSLQLNKTIGSNSPSY
jgi:hypothetical protein